MEIIWESVKNYIYKLACTSWYESCSSLETTECSLKQGNRFENSTKLPLPTYFLIMLCQLLLGYFFSLLFSHWMPCKQIAGMKTNNCSLVVCPLSQTVSGWFDTKLFWYKSFHFNSKSVRYLPKVDSVQAELTIRYKTL